MNTIQYIVVNKDLNMSAGKSMAQVAHAVNLVSEEPDIIMYDRAKQRTVIVLEGSTAQIENLWLYLYDRDIRAEYVIDEGVNEIPTMTITALATQQFSVEDEETRMIFSGFNLYKHGVFQR